MAPLRCHCGDHVGMRHQQKGLLPSRSRNSGDEGYLAGLCAKSLGRNTRLVENSLKISHRGRGVSGRIAGVELQVMAEVVERFRYKLIPIGSLACGRGPR